MSNRVPLLAVAVLVVWNWTFPAAAQSYPERPVRIISDSAAGGAADIGLRIIAEALSQHWGQQAIIVNQPGAGGAISARAAAESLADGYTLYAPSLSAFLALPGRAPSLPLILPRDFVAVGFTSEQPMSIGASSSLGVSSLAELVALARKRPGELAYGVSGVGRLSHLTGELIQLKADIQLHMIPYSSGGASHSVSDIIAGRIPLVIEAYSGLAGAYQSGQLKPLAIASERRLPRLPDIATVAETLPGVVATGWQVVVAPIGTPDVVIHKASSDLRTVLSKSDVRDKLAARGAEAGIMTPEEATSFVAKQQAMWRPVLEQIARQGSR